MQIVHLIIDIYLLSAGIIQNDKYKKYENLLFASLVILSTSLIIALSYAFLTATRITYRILLISYTVGSSTGFMLQVCSFLNKKDVVNLISTIRGENSTRVMNETHERLKPLLYPIIVLVLMTSAVFAMPGLSFFLDDNPDYNDPDFYMLLNLFDYWRVTSVMGMLARNSIQIVCLIPGSLTFFCGFVFMVFVTANLEAHCAEICRQFQQTVSSSVGDHHHHDHALRLQLQANALIAVDKSFHKNIRQIVRYQQFFDKYLRTFMKFMQWTSHIWLFWFMSGTVLIIFVLIQVEHKDIVFLTKNLFIAVDVPLQFYLCCRTSQIISHLNDYFLQSFYASSWYELPHRHRKSLNFMMMNNLRSKKILLLDMYEVNLTFFAKCLRIAYSVLNVLLCARKN